MFPRATTFDTIYAMQDGRDRSDVAYNWPRKILRVMDHGKIVYLDLNHWIALAKAKIGHPDGNEAQPLLAACTELSASEKAVFPISDSIYFELSKISHRQRLDLRKTIEEISQLYAILPIVTVVKYEVEEVLDRHFGPSNTPYEPVPYLGRGWAFALGSGEYTDEMSRIKEREVARIAGVDIGLAAAFGRFFDDIQALKETVILDGPTVDQELDPLIPHMRTGDIRQVMEARLRQEQGLHEFLRANPDIRKASIRDWVMNRSVRDDILGFICLGLLDRNVEFTDLCSTLDECRRLFDSMPSCDVMLTIRTMYHRNPEHKWSINDIHDTDILSSALPYCDFVLTDKAVATQASMSGLSDRLGTKVSHRRSDLLDFLLQA